MGVLKTVGRFLGLGGRGARPGDRVPVGTPDYGQIGSSIPALRPRGGPFGGPDGGLDMSGGGMGTRSGFAIDGGYGEGSLASSSFKNPLPAIGKAITGNPGIATAVLGAGASVYGTIKEGQAVDKQLAAQREAEQARIEEMRKQREDDRVKTLLQVMGSMR